MPFVIPIQDFEDAPEVLAVFAGSTELEATATVEQTFRANLQGSTQLQANGSLLHSASVVFAGGTELQATGRLNDEVNVFGAANFEGSTAFSANGSADIWAGAVFFAGGTELVATANVARSVLPSFTFIVDVHNPAASAALANPANVRRFAVRLLVDGSPVPLKSATINAPADTLGTELTCDLARPDVSQIPLDATVDFELGIWTGAAFAWERLLSSGKLSGRGKRVVNSRNLPVDVVTVSFVDVLGDRWNLAPSGESRIIYDPDAVDEPDTSTAGGSTYRLTRADGSAVETVAVASPGLDLAEVLRLAYVEGCGFDEVKTNVESFPVEQVAFTLAGGYDAGVRPLLRPFSPVAFPVQNTLWIADPDAALPAGLTPRPLTVSKLKEITSTLPNREPVDGLIATLKLDSDPGEYFTERLETPPPVETGDFGAENFTSTSEERRIREYRTSDAPEVIRREELASLKTTVVDFEGRVVSRETLTATFDGLNRQTGHRKSVEARLPDPATGDLLLQEVSRETQTITYGAHPLKPRLDTILRVETKVDGLILIDENNTYLDKPFRSPLLEAHRSGNIEVEAGQSTEFGAIKTIHEALRVRGDAVEMETRVINHITGAPDRTTTTTRPGSAELDRSSQATQTILLTLPGVTQRRRVAEADFSGLPYAVGLELANRLLRKLASPPLEFAGVLAFPDRSIRRGSVLDISERGGASLGTYIVTGYKYDFARSSGNALEITSTFTARQLTNQ